MSFQSGRSGHAHTEATSQVRTAKDKPVNLSSQEPDIEVPLLDLAAIHQPLMDKITHAMTEVLRTNRFIGGPEIEAFETELASYCGVPYAVGLSSGTDALIVTMMAMDIGPGDEVIVPSFTFFSTAGSVYRLGARPVFADMDPLTFNIDPDHVAELITNRTKAVIPVHLFGQTADMDRITAICEPRGIRIIEDAAQSIGAQYRGSRAGNLGDAGCFSFFPSKNLGGMGDGGAVVTTHAELADRIRHLRNHGENQRYHHAFVGGNFRLDAIQAAFLRVKLPELDAWHEQRRINANRYSQALSTMEQRSILRLPVEVPDRKHVYNQYVVRVEKRDELARHLTAHRVGNAIYYPVPLHLQKCFESLGYKDGDLPHSEKAAKEVLALPVFPGLSEVRQHKVIRCLTEFFS
ncbi:MAG: DegT/DnrJ/EryC1/StrS family aminotransferase [Thermodesulfobacteriota bacterium]